MMHGPALVLTYHHLADADVDPGGLSVTPEHFAQHLEVLAREKHPVPLRVLVQQLFTGEVRPGTVAITFDDGYLDNLTAVPLLERHDVPATVFVTAGADDERRAFWWDRLEALLLHPGDLPGRLELRIDGQPFVWNLGADASYDETFAAGFQSWRVWHQPATARHSLFLALRRLLASRPAGEQRSLMDEIEQWAGVIASDERHHRRLSDAEIVSLSRTPIIEVGAHTVTHPMLSTLGAAAQSWEIEENRRHLAAILGGSPTLFAYPYGDQGHDSVGLLREAGFTCGCTTSMAAVQPQTDPFRLPRCHVDDGNGETFQRWLERSWRA